uniref:CCDC66 domain-containing protein n=1 Tax=Graphocephala atropunctata TaxID=36148 RepID=A0A1B6LYT4_9HEMI
MPFSLNPGNLSCLAKEGLMDFDDDEFSVDKLQTFLKDQENKLKSDLVSLQKNKGLKFQSPTVGSHEEKAYRNGLGKSTDPQTCNNIMLDDKTENATVINYREKQKEKLINSLSTPKSRPSCLNHRVVNKLDSSRCSVNNSIVDSREKEKDRLAEIFASSGYQFSKKSNCQINKNLNSGLGFDKIESFGLKKNNNHNAAFAEPRFSQENDNPQARNLIDITKISFESDNCKYKIPQILVSDYQESSELLSNKTIPTISDSAMVRIGEFSPLNPNNPAGKPQLGFGEYEGRRKMLLDQRRQEYNQYLQQLSRKSLTPTRDANQNNPCKDAATQTGWEDEEVFNPESQKSPGHCSNSSFQGMERDCRSPISISPATRAFEGLSEKEVKEYLYREELRKQIEEKNRLRKEKKRREDEEEAKLEAKIERDQEEMKRQFEEERVQRLELALRKKEQDDILRQRLAAEQQKALQESKEKKKQQRKDKSTSPYEPSSLKSTSSPLQHPVVPLSRSLSSTAASKALSEVHEVLKQPLLESQKREETSRQSPRETEVPSRIGSAMERLVDVSARPAAVSPPIHKGKEVDMLVQRAVFHPNVQRRVFQDDLLTHHATNYREEVVKEPLLTESFRVLPPMSPPLLHATIPPVHPSQSPPIPSSKRVQRTNAELLEDKWKVPYEERYNAASPEVSTKHNRSVLTQLGAFRRHLQQERLRMQERVQAESP